MAINISPQYQQIESLVKDANRTLVQIDRWLKEESPQTIASNIDTISEQYQKAFGLYQQYHQLIGRLQLVGSDYAIAPKQTIQSWQQLYAMVPIETIQSWQTLQLLMVKTDYKLLQLTLTLKKIANFEAQKPWFYRRWAKNINWAVDSTFDWFKDRASAITVPGQAIYNHPWATAAVVGCGLIAAISLVACYQPNLLPPVISAVATQILPQYTKTVAGVGIAAAATSVVTAATILPAQPHQDKNLSRLENGVAFYSNHAIEYGLLTIGALQLLDASLAIKASVGLAHMILKATHDILEPVPVRLEA